MVNMRLPTASLSFRIVALLAISIFSGSGIVLKHAESLHRQSAFEQVKKQALMFLYWVESDIQGVSNPLDPTLLENLLRRRVEGLPKDVEFAVQALRLFGQNGEFLTGLQPNPSERRGPREVGADGHMEGHHPMHMSASGGMRHGMAVFSGQVGHLGGSVEHTTDPITGTDSAKTHLTIPIRIGLEIPLALEAELDLQETMARIRSADDVFEKEIVRIIGAFSLLILLATWLVQHWGLIKPLQELAAVTARIAAGNLGARARMFHSKEMGRLGQSINCMADSIQRLVEDEEKAYFQAMQSLAKALETKDAYTHQHSSRVTKYSVQLGQHLALPAEQLELLKRGAVMHDLGKIGIPDAILNKPDALTEEEFGVMRSHPVMTADIMRPLRRFSAFSEIATWHHERWDGAGYPDGLKGDEIPILARIVAIADTWDAMTGDRVYRKGMTRERALAILERERNSGQWDPELLDRFVFLIRGGKHP